MGDASGRQANHPAVARFLAWDDGSSRLLFIRSAAGTGRTSFARSWIGDRPGEVLDWSGNGIDAPAEVELLLGRLRADAGLHLAVILAPDAALWDLASRTPCLVARHRDLLLDAGETAGLLGSPTRPNQEEARRIHELSGGWLDAARALAADPGTHTQAQHIIRTGLAVWLAHRDPDGSLSRAGFLPVFDARTVESFYGEVSPVAHTLEELAEAGLVREDGLGGWMMPAMVRRVLVERTTMRGPESVAALEQAAINAVAATHGVREAVDSAVARRSWPALLNLLLEHWADIFLDGPRQLGALVARVPRFLARQTEYMGIGMQLLGQVDAQGVALQLPGFEPEYATNQTALRLHRDAERLYARPNTHALTVGVLQVLHLRTAGLYPEAAAAAERLRGVLHRALDAQRINPTLAALVELQAGISLYLAGHDDAARRACERGFHWAQVSGRPFLLADTAGKLALMEILDGDAVAARHWLRAHDAAIGEVGWGKAMVGRCVLMAKAYLALSGLDYPAFDEAVAALPPQPDNDEFWSVHAHLLVLRAVNAGNFDAARAQVAALRRERRHAAAAPLARRMLDDILLFAEILERGSLQTGAGDDARDPMVLALGHLLNGAPDAALAALQDLGHTGGLRRGGNVALYLELAARNPQGPTPEILRRMRVLHRDTGVLYDLAILGMVPGWSQVGGSLDLAPEELRLLGIVLDQAPATLPRRPVLSVREQEVLRQLREGMTRRQIAEAGFRSENTVKSQMRSLYRKLEASDMEQALENARSWGL
ncbi:LuxR C-terminal-related transcriptional regulator [Paeniglutamicibacter sp. R2-26]|uniref:helix-turn-helix transcriptional regulator n=1 Tax=Paeniglutamicibacter sp. R2-26 TaxID=3144417 RepID=UPI003EE63A98